MPNLSETLLRRVMGLFGSMNKVVVENQKMRKTILNQIGRIANLEKNQKYGEEKENGRE